MESVLVYTDEEYYNCLMDEREQDIMDINKNVHLVKDIYVDLGKLVGEQQEQVDDIENQISASLLDTENGVDQLSKAKRNQRTRNQCGFYIFCVALTGMVILFIVLYLR